MPDVTEHIEKGHLGPHLLQRSLFLGAVPGVQEESYIDLYTEIAPHLLLYQVFVELAHVRNREKITEDLPPLEYPIECEEQVFDDRIEHTYIVDFSTRLQNVGYIRNERIPSWNPNFGNKEEIVFQRQLRIVIVIDLAAPDYGLPVARRLKTVHPYGDIYTRYAGYGQYLYKYDDAVNYGIIDTRPILTSSDHSRTGY